MAVFLFDRMPGFGFMKVNVNVRQTIVTMLVNVNITPLTKSTPEGSRSESDDHQCNTKLQPRTDTLRNRHTQGQNNDANNQQRRGMTSAPQNTNKRRSQNVALLSCYRRNSDNVIDFRRVFQSED
jgi:hypothetical protein